MWHTLTPRQMAELEKTYMAETGVPGALLMEHAAQGVCDALARYASGGRVLFLCGPGNNGGDGYAAARLWQERGGMSVILELTPEAKGDARMNRALAAARGIPMIAADEKAEALPECDAVCDALFGTGLSRELTGNAAGLVRLANACGKPVVAVDIPSGLNGENGHVMGCAVRAAETVTFHRAKQGLLTGESADYAGRITVHPILIPENYGGIGGISCLRPEDLAALIPERRAGAHKGTCGRTVIFAGSLGMAGAAALCARAAIRAGSGLTTILARQSVVPVLQTLVPAATCAVLPEKDGAMTPECAEIAENALKNASAAAVGCGLGQSGDLLPLLRLFQGAECPVVWDADALNLLSAHRELLPLPAKDIVTPHPGEASRLTGIPAGEIAAEPLRALHSLREAAGCHVLLKGARSFMTDGASVAVNAVGSPSMAKGGSGDVLSGIMAGLLAQKLLPDTLTAMQAAALIHGMAGIRAAEKRGVESTSPEDLADAVSLR